ncbi:hypothetical protein ABK040_012695 [Willaertia magna]
MQYLTIKYLFFICFILSLSYFVLCEEEVFSHLDLEIKGTWKNTPLIIEASEFFADKYPEKYWTFLQKISCEKIENIKNDIPTILSFAKESDCSSAEVSLLDLALLTRHYSPRVKVQYSKSFNISNNDLNHFIQQSPSEIIHLDNIYNNNGDNSREILYVDITKQSGCNALKQAFKSNKSFILRHVMLTNNEDIDNEQYQMIKEKYMKIDDSKDLISLMGYGVELQIKNLEYKQTADEHSLGNETYYKGVNFIKLKHTFPHLANDLDTLKLHLQQSDSKTEKIKVWEMKDFGTQTVRKIQNSGDDFDSKLSTLLDISHNFPSYMKTLQETKFTEEFKNEIQQQLNNYEEEFKTKNPNNPQEIIRRNAIYLNGLELDLKKLSIFSLFEETSKELKFIDLLSSQYFLTQETVSNLLFKSSTASKDLRFRIPAQLEKHIVWFNNIEKENRYSNFPSELKTMLYPTMWGQMRFVKRNLFNVVYICDPLSTPKAITNILYMLGNIMNRGYPVRIGVLFIPNINEQVDSTKFVDVDLTGNAESSNSVPKASRTVTLPSYNLISLLEGVAKEGDLNTLFSILQSFMHNENFQDYFVIQLRNSVKVPLPPIPNEKLVERYDLVNQLGFNVKSAPILLFNGAIVEPDDPGMTGDQLIFKGIQSQYESIKQIIKDNIITDKDKNLLDKILSHYKAFDRFNGLIFNNPRYDLVSLDGLSSIDILQNIKDEKAIPITHIICMNSLNEKRTQKLIEAAVSHVSETVNTRIAFLSPSKDIGNLLSIHQKYHTKYSPLKSSEKKQTVEQFCSRYFTHNEYGGIMTTNGRVISLTAEPFSKEDFDLLESHENLPASVIDIIKGNDFQSKGVELNQNNIADITLSITSIMKVFNGEIQRRDMDFIHSNKHTTLQSGNNKANLNLVAIIDPLSKPAQKFVPMMKLLRDKLGDNIFIKIHLNPQMETSNLPLQSYYTYVTTNNSIAQFVTKYNDVKGLIFTLWMDVPESWLVESVYSKEDLDNLKLDECAKEKCYARFQLEHFVVTGTCIDDSATPVRGLQLELVPALSANQTVDDITIVMANYGYYQLKASSPNLFQMRLTPGRHSDIYSIQSTKQVDFYSQSELQFSEGSGPSDTTNHFVSVHSFDSPFVRVVVKRNSGMEKEDLLATVEKKKEEDSSWSWFGTKQTQEEEKTIHVFSLASGLMYERLLKIMILSVRKNLKRENVKVKFWFLKQFLSPSFKQFLPEYAKAYNFEYGLVSYQWPHWLLKPQTKQRLIWAYKVLFLDVLFPLQEVHKIVFVDADQVCRADLSELFFDLNMEGKSLAYTPFCDSRKEMEGYRFWKSGYWANHLSGRPYHISALYVVDIDLFRKSYHGDQFRMVYDNLAKDPNSLSNLDQDLPNYAQHQVPIKSLPQDWLWCESWCSDESKPKAKTIDLCNNPMTKEHKLASAKRIIPEWTDYDNEIKELQKNLVEEKSN